MTGLDEITNGLKDAGELLALAVEEGDADTAAEVQRDLRGFETRVEGLEFRRMFSGEMDANNADLDIQSRLQGRGHRGLGGRSGRYKECHRVRRG